MTPTTQMTPTTTTMHPVVTPQESGGTMKPAIIAAITIPIIVLIVILAAITGVIIHKIRAKNAAATTAGVIECHMQVNNAIYDYTMGMEGSAERPTAFENPLYANASNNPNITVTDADAASGIYASLDTLKLPVKSQDGEASPNPEGEMPSSDKADLVDNIQLDLPAKEVSSDI
jgi:hypothetical protein